MSIFKTPSAVGVACAAAMMVNGCTPQSSGTPLNARVAMGDLDSIGLPMHLNVTNNDSCRQR